MSCAQNQMDQPKLEVGDRWQFVRTVSPSGKVDLMTRTVAEIKSDGIVTLKFGDGTPQNYDTSLNVLGSSGSVEQIRRLVKYPLHVGDEWKFTIVPRDPLTGEESGTARVVALETLQVPAGTFQFFRVEAEGTQAANRTHTTNTIVHFWKRRYCPEVKWIGKEIAEERRSWAIPPIVVTTIELNKFAFVSKHRP